MKQWTTTVYGTTLADIQAAAHVEAERFGIDGPFDYDIRPHNVRHAADGSQFVVDYEATVSRQMFADAISTRPPDD